MAIIELTTIINAPVQICFDLARSIDLHKLSTEGTKEEAVAGVTSGLIGLNEEVTWEATHFGVRQRLSSRITAFDSPNHFRDEMIKGVFKMIKHDHYFNDFQGVTYMKDIFVYEAPLGILGKCADNLFLKTYLENLLIKRNSIIKHTAENTH
jgi:ligand-binding SRPBCC domain-containing protein